MAWPETSRPWCWHPRGAKAGTLGAPPVPWRNCIAVEADPRERLRAVIEHGFGVALYRIRSTFGRRWAGYLSLVVLVGLVGGLGLGSLAAARRTQSSFSTFLAATNPSDLLVSVYSGNSVASDNPDLQPTPHASHRAAPRRPARRARPRSDGRAAHRGWFTENQRHRAGVPCRQRQRALLHPGPHGGERGAPGVPAATQRDHDGARGGQAPAPPRRRGDPFRVLLEPCNRACRGSARRPCRPPYV